MTSSLTSREIRLTSYPTGIPTPANFAIEQAPVPALTDGQILVRNRWFSVDPYMRNRMDPRLLALSPFRIGEPLDGGAVGEVVATTSAVPVGATVTHQLGWREYAVLPASEAEVVDPAPGSAYLGVLGMTGLTAYAALTRTVSIAPGEVVFISAAAGAVGSVAGQLARILGAGTVIGSAGGPEKTKRLVSDLGFDAAVDYRAGSVADQLAAVAPDGIDVYFDNVGGEQLAAAIGALRPHGRVAVVGAISGYNAAEPAPGPDNLFQLIPKALTLRGLSVGEHFDLLPEYRTKAAGWLAAGSLRAEETVYDGIEAAVDGFLGLFHGANIGKAVVRLSG